MSPETLGAVLLASGWYGLGQQWTDVPGARWPGAVMANAFMIHGALCFPFVACVDAMIVSTGREHQILLDAPPM